jgi:hypothetical protein
MEEEEGARRFMLAQAQDFSLDRLLEDEEAVRFLNEQMERTHWHPPPRTMTVILWRDRASWRYVWLQLRKRGRVDLPDEIYQRIDAYMVVQERSCFTCQQWYRKEAPKSRWDGDCCCGACPRKVGILKVHNPFCFYFLCFLRSVSRASSYTCWSVQPSSALHCTQSSADITGWRFFK